MTSQYCHLLTEKQGLRQIILIAPPLSLFSQYLVLGGLIDGESIHQCGWPGLGALLAFALLLGRLNKVTIMHEDMLQPSPDGLSIQTVCSDKRLGLTIVFVEQSSQSENRRLASLQFCIRFKQLGKKLATIRGSRRQTQFAMATGHAVCFRPSSRGAAHQRIDWVQTTGRLEQQRTDKKAGRAQHQCRNFWSTRLNYWVCWNVAPEPFPTALLWKRTEPLSFSLLFENFKNVGFNLRTGF